MRNLKTIFQEDQKDRHHQKLTASEEGCRDAQRRQEVRRIIAQKKRMTGADCYHAAFIFHHGPSKADAQRAVRLAKESKKRGYEKANLLYVAATDRLLIKEGKRQKFGTQFHKKKGAWKLLPMDHRTTDAQRANFNVPTLAQLKEQAKTFP